MMIPSFESNANAPLPVVSEIAMPLLVMLPLAQPCTRVVMSMTRNWFMLAAVMAMG